MFVDAILSEEERCYALIDAHRPCEPGGRSAVFDELHEPVVAQRRAVSQQPERVQPLGIVAAIQFECQACRRQLATHVVVQVSVNPFIAPVDLRCQATDQEVEFEGA